MFPLSLMTISTVLSSLLGLATAQVPTVVYRADFRSPSDIKFGTPFYHGYSADSFSTKRIARYYDPGTKELVLNSIEYRPYDLVQKRLTRFKKSSTPISTSSNRDFAKEFALRITNRRRIYIYYIDTTQNELLDIAAIYKEYGKTYPVPEEAEFLVLSKVRWRSIVGWIEFDPVGMESTLDVLGTGPSRTRKTSESRFYVNEAYWGTVKVNEIGDIIKGSGLHGDEMLARHIGIRER
ncbi:uncharacterized protein PgNI_02502 [Pyricularia grisea]|uniref:Uncharacterized protein n=1 Tax=Pyricularia grisea TaxID=148305 RepID=A0A6P8BJ40_PYRGI|nr:uncharacterized protein PgNI_02502 [Pyricularia grisea]TLD16679.1 hypothetical protein PgNI_02502 [Pyricularia grisea]